MDTRSKILTPAAAAEALARLRGAAGLTVVTGHFDPLLASHARRLEEIAAAGGTLAAVVTSSADPVLPARARAELVAGLGAVRCVVLPGEEPVEGVLDRLRADAVVREEAADAERTRELIQLVHGRQYAV